jgi:hypothetical protein
VTFRHSGKNIMLQLMLCEPRTEYLLCVPHSGKHPFVLSVDQKATLKVLQLLCKHSEQLT